MSVLGIPCAEPFFSRLPAGDKAVVRTRTSSNIRSRTLSQRSESIRTILSSIAPSWSSQTQPWIETPYVESTASIIR